MSIETFKRSRELASPVRDWDGYVSYEAMWDRLLCEPEPETADTTYRKLKAAEEQIRRLEFAIYRVGGIVTDCRRAKNGRQ